MKPLLPLCSIPKAATRDGYGGPFARLLLPFYSFGYWFASGQQFTYPGARIRQDNTKVMGGINKPANFEKNPGICISGR